MLPVLLPVILALAMLPLIGSASSWVTLTVASLAMGMMIFIMASGLTLVFGLMDVLNFGHGAFIAVGAYIATLVLLPLAPYVQADSLWTILAVLAPAAVLAMAVSGALGLVVERVLILPVYGQHLKQILMKEPRKMSAAAAGSICGPHSAYSSLFGDDQSADRHQDLLEMLAVDRQDRRSRSTTSPSAPDTAIAQHRGRRRAPPGWPAANWPARTGASGNSTSVAT